MQLKRVMRRARPGRWIVPLFLLVCLTGLTPCAPGSEAVDGVEPGGDIPLETAAKLLESPGVHIVDVRTEAEFAYVGHPVGAVNIPLLRFDPQSYGMTPNPDFVDQVRERFSPDDTLLMICRSGGRSARAARMLVEAGYPKAYNILEGVEGGKDDDGHRTVNGWKVRGLPYEYNVRPADVTPPSEDAKP